MGATVVAVGMDSAPLADTPKTPGGREEFEIIREYQSQTAAYQTSMKEQMMKKQYDKLYWEVKDELKRGAKF